MRNTNDKPEENKVYALTSGFGKPSIANGNTWAESEVKDSLVSLKIYEPNENDKPKCHGCGVVVFPEDDNCCDRCLELSYNKE
jgi:hypothetical protein